MGVSEAATEQEQTNNEHKEEHIQERNQEGEDQTIVLELDHKERKGLLKTHQLIYFISFPFHIQHWL